MTPLRCERCGRDASTWSVDRLRRSAGCPCGEVIEVFFDDDVAVVLSKAPRPPSAWVEAPAMDAWQAEFRSALRPAMLGTWAIVAAALTVGAIVVLARALQESLVAVVGISAIAGIGYALARGEKARTGALELVRGRLRTQIRIGHGRVGILAPGRSPAEAPIDEVRDCAVSEGPQDVSDARVPTFVLAIRLRDGRRQQVPLFVADAAEAQFVVNRINEVLAVEGRDTMHGYRGDAPRAAR